MKTLTAVVGTFSVLLALGSRSAANTAPAPAVREVSARHATSVSADALTNVVKLYCTGCHNDKMRTGNLSLATFDVATAATRRADVAEKMVAKLRAGMMPPPGQPRPSPDTLRALLETLETQLDAAAAAKPNPGRRTFQRLNRAEYSAAIRMLLGLDVEAGVWLPLDTKSDNFDNIADVQVLSPTLLDGYLRAAGDISWMAVGNPAATAISATYSVPRTASQVDHVEGAPFGTRGGLSVVHNFPADGDYVFKANFFHETTGAFAGSNQRGEQLDISIDGARVAVLDIDRFMHASDPNGVTMATEPVRLTAGPHRVSAAFIPPAFQDVVQDLVSPLKWSLNSTSTATAYGFTLLPHLRDLVIGGPFNPTGVSDSPVRQRIFACRPVRDDEARACATSIVSRLARDAYRRPLTDHDLGGLLSLYDGAAAKGGFESGVRTAIEAILASPDFVFRFERAPAGARHVNAYRLSDIDLASRLSFFIWSAPPDDALLTLATQGKLSQQPVLDRQVRRMLADPRSAALATRFAAQWLRLPDLDKVQPEVRQYPDFDEQLRASMRRETELFFQNLVNEDRNVMDLFTADYTFVNERLAQHYGMPNVAGSAFRRVKYTTTMRRGLLAHASILTLTSHASRTSAVDRGKWVMEVFLNSPPPPPPPGVPDLEVTPGSQEGRLFTVRERMEQHRKDPMCSSCHKMMDPIGLSLENFDVTGRWRLRDNGGPIDSKSTLWDGTPVTNVADLRGALVKRRETLMRTFTLNLMAYGIGRRVEYYDMPTVRAIVRSAGTSDNRFSAYVMGIVNSPAFRMQRSEIPEPTRTME
jgi:hypothetical protein